MQNTISECTTRRTLKQVDYSSRRPHRVLLLSAKHRKRRLQFAPHRLNATAFLSIVADHVHLFMTIVDPSSDATSSRIMHRHKAQIISDWFLEHDNEFTLLKWPPQSPDLNLTEHLWDVVEREIHIMDVQPTNLQQLRENCENLWGMFPTPRWIYATKN